MALEKPSRAGYHVTELLHTSVVLKQRELVCESYDALQRVEHLVGD